MKTLLLPCALVALLCSCATNPATGAREFDVAAVRQELHLVRMDIQSAAEILAAGDPDAQAKLAEAIRAADAVGAALDAWMVHRLPDDRATLLEATALAFDVADSLVAEFAGDGANVTQIRLALFAAEAVMRRVEAYAG